MTNLYKRLVAANQNQLVTNAEVVFKEYEEDKEGTTFTDFCNQYDIFHHYYSYECYSGESYTFGYDKKNEKFFEVHGSHCSCYGLESQFRPELCTEEELQELYKRRASAKSYGKTPLTLAQFLDTLGVAYGKA